MQKTYIYENAVVVVIKPDGYTHDTLRSATKSFLRKVMEERLYGNSDKTRAIAEK